MPRGTPSKAKNTPVIAGPNEMSSGGLQVPQREVNETQEFQSGIEVAERMPAQDYADLLKFAEDPITVVLTPSSDPKAAKSVFCAVNGKGAEVWDERSKRWVEFKWLPVARVLTVKRKCLEVLARSRVDTCATREVTPTPHANQDGFVLETNTVPTVPFTVRHDPAGAKGAEWFNQVMQQY